MNADNQRSHERNRELGKRPGFYRQVADQPSGRRTCFESRPRNDETTGQ